MKIIKTYNDSLARLTETETNILKSVAIEKPAEVVEKSQEVRKRRF